MKKIYLIFKILLILVALIAVAYLVTPPDSDVILKRPWLAKEGILNISSNTQSANHLHIGLE